MSRRTRPPSGLWILANRRNPTYIRDSSRLGTVGRAVYWLERRGGAQGVEFRHPLLDLRLREFVASLPPRFIRVGDMNRAVLRRAMEDILPDFVRFRTDKTSFRSFTALSQLGKASEKVRMLLDDLICGKLGLVDVALARDAFAGRPGSEIRIHEVSNLWFLVTAEIWLRHLPSCSGQSRGGWPRKA